MSKIAVLQPSYLPWLGYFEQMTQVDTFVFYDDVQYTKNDWRNRNRVRGQEGYLWLTIPSEGSTHLQIREVKIDPRSKWQDKHRKTLAQFYSGSPFFEEVSTLLEPLWQKEYRFLMDAAVDSVGLIAGYLDISPKIVFSSDLGVGGERNERLIGICEALGAREYYSGLAAESYLDRPLFREHGIEVAFQHYDHPLYPQRGEGFLSHLSAIDLLFNCGKNSRGILGGA